ncbi:response regulator transcription factor [Vulgatibacter incomptus]|uniref:Heme response regulator HssR n=1 Tax=Vulgatibacter incomptus TaxID=1391653 RepID=A0A0K1PFN2_9BACT|nr:response regulator transcription factor [Vulgatibacter incomptus]AKU92343.1 DNA-binding response regulator [Vulgatibacter incomptus]
MTRVLVVDDDPHLRELVRHNLSREGFAVREASNGAAALEALETSSADLVVVDVMMPKMDGFELCRELRESNGPPVLMLTARGATADKVRGLGLGADDYLVKPFEPAELVARVKAILRRYRVVTSSELEVGRLVLDRAAFDVRFEGARLTLPRKEFELLFHLAGQAGRTLTRDHLIEQLWGFDYEGDERTVDVHVKRLRDRFPEEQAGFRIRTIRGLGYRLEKIP